MKPISSVQSFTNGPLLPPNHHRFSHIPFQRGSPVQPNSRRRWPSSASIIQMISPRNIGQSSTPLPNHANQVMLILQKLRSRCNQPSGVRIRRLASLIQHRPGMLRARMVIPIAFLNPFRLRTPSHHTLPTIRCIRLKAIIPNNTSAIRHLHSHGRTTYPTIILHRDSFTPPASPLTLQ